MANWLEKLVKTQSPAVKGNTLPVKAGSKQLATHVKTQPEPVKTLPFPSIIYGISASIFFVIALYFLLTGPWFVGFLILLPAICFLGFALHFIRTG